MSEEISMEENIEEEVYSENITEDEELPSNDVQEGNPENYGPQGYALEDIKRWLEQLELSTEGTEEEVRARWAEHSNLRMVEQHPNPEDVSSEDEQPAITVESVQEEEIYPKVLFEFEEKWGTHFVRAIGDLPVFKGKLNTGPNTYIDVYGLKITAQQFCEITGEEP